jgi:hypothetical protein
MTSLKEVFKDMAVMVEEPDVLSIEAGLETALCDLIYRETLLKRFSETRPRFSWKNAARDLREIIGKLGKEKQR